MQITISNLDPKLVCGPAYQGVDKPQRSSGLHLSDVYQDIVNTVAPREEMEQEQLEAYRSVGFVWEHIVSRGLRDSLVSDSIVAPGEYTLDGITGSPDLLDVSHPNPDEWVVVDTKATYKSIRKIEQIEKYFWSWMMQTKGYCKMVGTVHARFDILFMCGDWKPPRPMFRRVVIKYSQREIEDNWAMIVNHARKRGWLK